MPKYGMHFAEPEEGEVFEIEDEDITTEDYMHWYQDRRMILETSSEEDDYVPALKAYMEQDQYWPNIWYIDDHGGLSLIVLEG